MSDESKLAMPGTVAWLEQNPPDMAKWECVQTAPKHRIVQAWHGQGSGCLWVLGSDGRIFVDRQENGWIELDFYPPGLEP